METQPTYVPRHLQGKYYRCANDMDIYVHIGSGNSSTAALGNVERMIKYKQQDCRKIKGPKHKECSVDKCNIARLKAELITFKDNQRFIEKGPKIVNITGFEYSSHVGKYKVGDALEIVDATVIKPSTTNGLQACYNAPSKCGLCEKSGWKAEIECEVVASG